MTQGEKVALTREEVGRILELANLVRHVRDRLNGQAHRVEDRGGYGGGLWDLAEVASGLADDVEEFGWVCGPDHNENAEEG